MDGKTQSRRHCKKLTKALQRLDDAGRPKHDGDAINWIWRRVQSGELSHCVSAPKVGQSVHLRTPKQTLQEIAKEVPDPSKGSNFEPRISEIQRGPGKSGGLTFDGSASGSGAHASNGELGCGTCGPGRWLSNDVKPFHEQIRGHRDKQGPHQSITCLVIFVVKLGENFRRKARRVAGGHQAETPETLTRSSVVSRDSVGIALVAAALK